MLKIQFVSSCFLTQSLYVDFKNGFSKLNDLSMKQGRFQAENGVMF